MKSEKELGETVRKTATISNEVSKKYAIELLQCLKIWGLNYSDAVMVSQAMIDELLDPNIAETWKPGSEKNAKAIYGMVDSIKRNVQ